MRFKQELIISVALSLLIVITNCSKPQQESTAVSENPPSLATHQVSPEEVRKLVQMGNTYSGDTFIAYAKEGNTEVVKLFLAEGMNPNVKDGKGGTALIYAAWHGHTNGGD